MPLRISWTLAIDIKGDFATRMCSIGKTHQEIDKLDIFLSVSLQNVNDLPAGRRENKRPTKVYLGCPVSDYFTH
jgi:hypothetical protein